MNANIGKSDKIIRYFIAATALVLYLTNTVTGGMGILMIVIAAVLIVTNLISFCPLYLPFGINTNKLNQKKNA